MVKDSAPEKWVYRRHTQVKHQILADYLERWVNILGTGQRQIYYIDGFAGRCEYFLEENGSKVLTGSPLVAMEAAQALSRRHAVAEVICLFIESDPENFESLEQAIAMAKKEYPWPTVRPLIRGEFANHAPLILQEIRNAGAPSFWFIDPFGVKGVPFELVSEIMSVERAEVFFTFMYEYLRRFIEETPDVVDNLFGTNRWREIVKTVPKGLQQEYALRDLYIEQLLAEGNTSYAFPFRVMEPSKRETKYYLVHATNHIKGLWEMREAMDRHGAPGMFAFLGPDELVFQGQQLPYFSADEQNVEQLRTEILSRFPPGSSAAFAKIRAETWRVPCVRRHYKHALLRLWREGKISVQTIPPRQFKGGFQEFDVINFL